jgi:hypothetical protein
MLCSEMFAVCPEFHTKHSNTLSGKNVQFLMQIIFSLYHKYVNYVKVIFNSRNETCFVINIHKIIVF